MFAQVSDKYDRKTVVACIAYTLPHLFIAIAPADGSGKFRFRFRREDIAVTSR